MGRLPRFRLTPPVRVKLVEAHVVKACLDILHLKQYWTAKLHAGVFKTLDGNRYVTGVPKGTPDYIAVHQYYPGFLVEFKRPGQSPTPEQEQVALSIRLGYRLATAAVDSVDSLSEWLRLHEAKWARGP